MKKKSIRINDRIDTLEGYIIIKGRHSEKEAWADNYVSGWDDEKDEPTDEMVKDGERLLTMNEIANLMHEADGQLHEVFWTPRFAIRDREAGNEIDFCDNLPQAISMVNDFEKVDKEEGTFEEDFYEICDLDTGATYDNKGMQTNEV